MARVLVTGGAGLIGSHLVDYLLNWGHNVWVIDNLSTGLEENLSPEVKRNFYRVDLRRKDMTNLVLRIARPEIVFHLAAWAHEGLSQFCPNLIIENNINASMNLLVSSIRQKVKRFVFTSSMSVYGDQESPFTEDMPRKPVDIYGIAKTSFENSLEVMAAVYGFEYTIVRPHNVIGPRQALHDPYRNVVAIFMNRLLQDKPFYIYGDGNQRRAFSNIKDAAPYIAKAGFADEAKGQIFNIGADKHYSINEMAQMLLEISGKKSLKPIYVEDRKQEVDDAWCDNSKIRKILGFEDKISLKDGLKEMWAWAKKTGYKKPKYLPYLELTQGAPETWTNKLI